MRAVLDATTLESTSRLDREHAEQLDLFLVGSQATFDATQLDGVLTGA